MHSEPQIEARNWQLFLDDHACARLTGFDRVVHHPRPAGVVIPADRPWESSGVSPVHIWRDSAGAFHCIYSATWWDIDGAARFDQAWRVDRAHNIYRAYAYARSGDGIHWEKPRLGVMDAPAGTDRERHAPFPSPVGTTRENNLGAPLAYAHDLGQWGDVQDPERRYAVRLAPKGPIGVGASWKHEPRGYFLADLPDVERVVRDGDESWRAKLVDSGGNFDPRHHGLGYWDALHSEWVTLTQGVSGHWIPSRDVARFASTDLLNWTATSVLYPDALDAHRPDHYEEPMGMLPFCDSEAGEDGTVFGLLSWFHSDRSHPDAGPTFDPTPEHPAKWPWCRKGTNDMRIAVSHDGGYTWSRDSSREAWIPHGTEHDSYDRLVIGASSPVRVGDEDWFYAGVIDGDHLGIRNDSEQSAYYHDRLPLHQIALYRQKRHRYVSLRASVQPERLISRPFVVTGERLELNADAGHGRIRCALADATPVELYEGSATAMAPHLYESRHIDGYSLDDCKPLRSDSLAHSVSFARSVGKLKGRTVRLVVEAADADLYGFRIS